MPVRVLPAECSRVSRGRERGATEEGVGGRQAESGAALAGLLHFRELRASVYESEFFWLTDQCCAPNTARARQRGVLKS